MERRNEQNDQLGQQHNSCARPGNGLYTQRRETRGLAVVQQLAEQAADQVADMFHEEADAHRVTSAQAMQVQPAQWHAKFIKLNMWLLPRLI